MNKEQNQKIKTKTKETLNEDEKNEEQISLKGLIEKKDKEINEYIETLKRLQAEFENYKKREEKDKIEHKKILNAELVKKILPVLDSFEIAFKNSKNPETFKKGMELIYAQLLSTLKEQGLRKIDCCNYEFDPYRHEVLLTEESDKKEGTILEELQSGYMLNDLVIRHSKVKIAKQRKGNYDENTSDLGGDTSSN